MSRNFSLNKLKIKFEFGDKKSRIQCKIHKKDSKTRQWKYKGLRIFFVVQHGLLHFIERKNMDVRYYLNILSRRMLPFAEWNLPLIWKFQKDHDKKITSKTIKR